MTIRTLLLSSLALALAACSTTKNSQTSERSEHSEYSESSEYSEPSDKTTRLAQKNNTFALRLFSEIGGMDSHVVSPLSVTYLMGMLANGADRQTRQEILTTMGWKDESLADVNAFSLQLIEQATRKGAKNTVSIANYVALNNQLTLKQAATDSLKHYFQASVEPLDFSSDATKGHINAWCSDHTRGMIPSIIDDLDPSALAYIMNAIYFDGSWKNAFDKSATKEERFQGYTRDVKRVQMMWQSARLPYTSNDTYAALQLPYAAGEYTMTLLLPNEGKSIAEMMQTVTTETFSHFYDGAETCIVDLKLPRFTTEMKLQLNDLISKLGAPSMFSPATADFSLLSDHGLFISRMLQKAKIEVSETGTKAAAVTAATVMLTSLDHHEPRHVDFHADRPFVYTITDTSTGAILFIGQFTGE